MHSIVLDLGNLKNHGDLIHMNLQQIGLREIEMLPERRGVFGGSDLIKAADHGLLAVRRGRRYERGRLLFWIFSFAALFSIRIATFGFKMFFHDQEHNLWRSLLVFITDQFVGFWLTWPMKKCY